MLRLLQSTSGADDADQRELVPRRAHAEVRALPTWVSSIAEITSLASIRTRHQSEITPVVVEDCSWLAWETWGSCSQSCGSGTRMRRRGKIEPEVGGTECVGMRIEKQNCPPKPCPKDCEYSGWSDWGGCSVTCGGGDRWRQRTMRQPSYGGKECDKNLASEKNPCGETPCPAHCRWASWGAWSACSQTCGTGPGMKVRFRNFKTLPTRGGVHCSGDSFMTTQCNQASCGSTCTWSPWTNWTACSTSCGLGQRLRWRDQAALSSPKKPCQGNLVEMRPCNMSSCPLDCTWQAWSDWSSCTTRCGGGERQRIRWPRTTNMSEGSKPCAGDSVWIETCNLQAC